MSNAYSTHLPVFETLFMAKRYSKILEFGMGFGSTPFLLNHCDSLTSIEMQSEQWFQNVYEKLNHETKWRSFLALGPFEFQKNNVINEKYDLVFVDGHGDSRPEVINSFFNKCDTIVTHDFETLSYRWDLIQQPSDYIRIVYTKLNPYTAIFTKDHTISELF
jgi:predicted O-methyltransferase YrrM